MRQYGAKLDFRVKPETVQHLKLIANRHHRSMSDIVRLLIEREACYPSDPASLLAPCPGQVLADKAGTGKAK